MPGPHALRRAARRAPAPFDALLELANGAQSDVEETLVRLLGDGPETLGNLGDDLAAWDPEHIEHTLPTLRAINHAWFRPEVRGVEHIPDDGASLLVGNHSGGLYIADTFVFAYEFYAHFGSDRRFHQLAHDLIARSPLFGLLRRYGVLAASHDNGRRALRSGAPLLVYPGGDHETFRPSWHQGKIEFDGRSGFVRLAQEEEVPIVPVVAIGGQETALFVTRGRRAAKVLGLDKLRVKVLPVSIGPPFGINLLDLPGRIALPAQITLQVLPPIHVDRKDDRREAYDHVTRTMQHTLDELEEERSPVPLVG